MNCESCESCRAESWTRDEVAFRCFDKRAGYFYGRVVTQTKKGYEKSVKVEAPAWCPEKEAET